MPSGGSPSRRIRYRPSGGPSSHGISNWLKRNREGIAGGYASGRPRRELRLPGGPGCYWPGVLTAYLLGEIGTIGSLMWLMWLISCVHWFGCRMLPTTAPSFLLMP